MPFVIIYMHRLYKVLNSTTVTVAAREASVLKTLTENKKLLSNIFAGVVCALVVVFLFARKFGAFGPVALD